MWAICAWSTASSVPPVLTRESCDAASVQLKWMVLVDTHIGVLHLGCYSLDLFWFGETNEETIMICLRGAFHRDLCYHMAVKVFTALPEDSDEG